MPRIKEWNLETFAFGALTAQKISFSIDHHDYIMVFSPVAATYGDTIGDKEAEFGMTFPANTFEMKFDRQDNFEEENFFVPPSASEDRLAHSQLNRLGNAISQILDFHMSTTSAQLYIAIAENPKLKTFYARLAKKHAQPLNCTVSKDIGEEGLGYAIRTPHFQS
ncbi:hypothetical protein [Aeromonas sp. BIGb0445]|uniref:hypothetical protein n=1 Tax=Aeromonas sp. BIGb0445 TaxID=2940593 RepID=UPI0021686EF5|nr:hypothetical protein [Aeromonas sp. BIGb0445]MCS3458574.1 hypothetical protein [Aeromonas sp. BIGb0445]